MADAGRSEPTPTGKRGASISGLLRRRQARQMPLADVRASALDLKTHLAGKRFGLRRFSRRGFFSTASASRPLVLTRSRHPRADRDGRQRGWTREMGIFRPRARATPAAVVRRHGWRADAARRHGTPARAPVFGAWSVPPTDGAAPTASRPNDLGGLGGRRPRRIVVAVVVMRGRYRRSGPDTRGYLGGVRALQAEIAEL
jgi:hypothetical protein